MCNSVEVLTKNDIDNVRKECNLVENDKASLNEKIFKKENYDLHNIYKGNSLFFDRTDKLHKDLINTNDFIHHNFIKREEFLRFLEKSGLRKLIQQQDKKSPK